jgi:hypothetical protein
MRMVGIVLAALLVAAPALAQYNQAPAVPRECRRIANQIGRYQGDVRMARERGNELWENASRAQIDRLESRLVDKCPELAKDDRLAKALAKIIDIASELAWKYFTYQY